MLVAAAVGQLGDLHPAEEAERAQPPPALELILQAERLTRLELQLAQDDVGLGVHVADDQDVVDRALRPLLDHERQVDARAIGARRQADVENDGGKAAIEVFEHQRIARLDGARLEVRIAGLDFDERAAARQPGRRRFR